MENVQQYKEKLETELKTLTEEMQGVGQVNPDATNDDWEAKGNDLNVQDADANERADRMEQYELNSTVLKNLEVRYNNVKAALARIEDGTYGVCVVGGESIEPERLEANPAATTCVKHIEQES